MEHYVVLPSMALTGERKNMFPAQSAVPSGIRNHAALGDGHKWSTSAQASLRLVVQWHGRRAFRLLSHPTL